MSYLIFLHYAQLGKKSGTPGDRKSPEGAPGGAPGGFGRPWAPPGAPPGDLSAPGRPWGRPRGIGTAWVGIKLLEFLKYILIRYKNIELFLIRINKT